ncbi:FAD/NAD(P)-binding domain-containing protein [Nadsonia fulvescens var. elongata DSM 6958]|uniref:FAD/NAD(P)-binding domain-containing protein n=1 Tax=Nadsonia fulvescens var. elongata DSM 6958 TaxID=857566 RepID=A0A1E3PEG8_9ASCO|nr:FAD/NAD(P)-binding domain-containing protein [Nadsonia fulvescens var. elongata DSM 6958]
MTVSSPKYRRVAIIGGGPAGLAAAKALGLEPTKFERVDLFERKENIGGLWYYTGKTTEAYPPVPSVDPNVGDVFETSDHREKYFSPMYKNLETNIVSSVMEYHNFPFPKGTSTFPTRNEVFEYLENYSKTIPSDVNIKVNSNVLSLTKKDGVWEVVVENFATLEISKQYYDGIVLANGHFDVPYIPKVGGLKDWNEKKPGSITHAKYFDEAKLFDNQNVLIIGNSASGIDISTQLSIKAKKVYVSSRDKSQVADIINYEVTNIGMITKYDFDDDRSVTTVDGQRFNGIDSVIFCTGYLYSLPFLKSYLTGDDAIITDGSKIHYLDKQIFYIPDPSLAFIAIPKFIIPMPLSESQAAVVARVFSGRLTLASETELRDEYSKEIEQKGNGSEFHFLKFPADVEYCRSLQSWVDENGLGKTGSQAPVWDEAKYKDREETADIKAKRLLKIVEHANKLRESGEDFRLLTE